MKADELAVKLGRRIRELRKQKGLTQEDMEEFGIPYKYYQRIESPGSRPANLTLKTLLKIARALDVELSDLFQFAEPAKTRKKK
jgi:transcriptional regulator with XRE-family HTH domain